MLSSSLILAAEKGPNIRNIIYGHKTFFHAKIHSYFNTYIIMVKKSKYVIMVLLNYEYKIRTKIYLLVTNWHRI